MYKRIVIKLSGEALANTTSLYDNETITSILTDIKTISQKGVQVAIAVGGGNIWRGRQGEDMDPVKADQMGMLSTVINAMYLCDRLISMGQPTEVFTPFTVGNFTSVYSKEAANAALNTGKVIIFGGGLGHPFFSTDTIPVLRACELEADCVFFAKNVSGIFDKDPNKFDDAKHLAKTSYREIITENLEAIDIAAMVLCEKNKIPSFVFSLNHPHSIELAAMQSEQTLNFGTIIEF